MLTRSVILALVVVSLALVGGCTSSDHKAGWNARGEVGAIWGVGEQGVDSELKRVDKGMSESHRMMAVMILNGAGENTDLESYEDVYLVDVSTNNGSNTATVVVIEDKNGGQRTIIPQAVRDQGNINAP
jgi:hypothetical protein